MQKCLKKYITSFENQGHYIIFKAQFKIKCTASLKNSKRDFPGGPVAKTALPM